MFISNLDISLKYFSFVLGINFYRNNFIAITMTFLSQWFEIKFDIMYKIISVNRHAGR